MFLSFVYVFLSFVYVFLSFVYVFLSFVYVFLSFVYVFLSFVYVFLSFVYVFLCCVYVFLCFVYVLFVLTIICVLPDYIFMFDVQLTSFTVTQILIMIMTFVFYDQLSICRHLLHTEIIVLFKDNFFRSDCIE